MTVAELLKADTSKMSLSDMIAKVGDSVLEDEDGLYQLRKRHEADSSIPMEEDDFGNGERNGIHESFPEITKSLNDVLERE